jgi:hypothetical protein
MSNKVKYIIDKSFYSFIKSKYIINNNLAYAISSKNIDTKSLCRGGGKLISKYDRHNNIPFLATQLNIDFKMDSNGNVKQPCKLCEYVISTLKNSFYSFNKNN